MRWYLVMFLWVIAMSPVIAIEEIYFLENLSYSVTKSTLVTTSYVFDNTTLLGPAQNYTVTRTQIQHNDSFNSVAHYTITGPGFVQVVTDARCDDSDCTRVLHVDNPTVESKTLEHSLVPLNASLSYQFNVTFIELDIEPGEYWQLHFFNGATYDMVYQYNGTDNGLNNATWTSGDKQKISLTLSSAYKHSTFKWMFTTSYDGVVVLSTGDAVILDSVLIETLTPISAHSPEFFHSFPTNHLNVHEVVANLYYTVSSDTAVSVFLRKYGSAGNVVDEYVTVRVPVLGLNNVTLSLFNMTTPTHINTSWSIVAQQNLTEDNSFTFHYGDVAYASQINMTYFVETHDILTFNFSNASFPYLLQMEYNSTSPIANASLYRDGNFIGLMTLCAANIYCFYDSQVSAENGTAFYEVDLFTITGHMEETSLLAFFDPVRAVILNPLFQGEFFVPLNVSTAFSLFIHDTKGAIVTDADISLNFTTLGIEFNLTYTPATQQYTTNILFAVGGEYPYVVELGPAHYQIEPSQAIHGTVFVEEPTTVCFRVYTDRNVTQPYENDLATVMMFDSALENVFSSSIRQLSYWTEGKANGFPMNVLHAPYIDGDACLQVYNQSTVYAVWLMDGVFQFKDNYDPPTVLDYFGTSVELSTLKVEPDTTYNIYVPRLDITWRRIFNNLWSFIIFVCILVFLAFCFSLGGPIGALVGLVLVLLFYFFVEFFLKVFV